MLLYSQVSARVVSLFFLEISIFFNKLYESYKTMHLDNHKGLQTNYNINVNVDTQLHNKYNMYDIITNYITNIQHRFNSDDI